MRVWDSSALVALLVAEPDSPRRATQLREDPVMAVGWSTLVECESALQRRAREGALNSAGPRLARARLTELAAAWHEDPMQRPAAAAAAWALEAELDGREASFAICDCVFSPENREFPHLSNIHS